MPWKNTALYHPRCQWCTLQIDVLRWLKNQGAVQKFKRRASLRADQWSADVDIVVWGFSGWQIWGHSCKADSCKGFLVLQTYPKGNKSLYNGHSKVDQRVCQALQIMSASMIIHVHVPPSESTTNIPWLLKGSWLIQTMPVDLKQWMLSSFWSIPFLVRSCRFHWFGCDECNCE